VVAQLAAAGHLHDEIAMAYLMTTSTVAAMMESVQQRLGAQTPEELRDALARLG
jgi:DNA-binding NarL/FixJ family response regulator